MNMMLNFQSIISFSLNFGIYCQKDLLTTQLWWCYSTAKKGSLVLHFTKLKLKVSQQNGQYPLQPGHNLHLQPSPILYYNYNVHYTLVHFWSFHMPLCGPDPVFVLQVQFSYHFPEETFPEQSVLYFVYLNYGLITLYLGYICLYG